MTDNLETKAPKKAKAVKPAEHGHGHTAAVVVKKQSEKQNIYDKGLQYYGTGRRKNAIARVFVRPGTGKFMINDRESAAYLDNREVLIMRVNKPLKIANLEKAYDISVDASGGGKSGQAGAIAHGLTKAILEINPDLRKILKIEGLITRDPRVKEAKKFGRKRARKRFTYRKR